MKKIVLISLAICCIFSTVFAASFSISAEEANTVILFENARQTGKQITVDVNARENSGVYSMLLTLDYDIEALTLINLTYGEAMSSLEPLSSADYFTNPFKISYMGTDKQNDTSVGNMMTLTFEINEDAVDGEYDITFKYAKNKDVAYLKDEEIKTKNLIIDGIKIKIADGDVEKIENGEMPQTEEFDRAQEGGFNLGLILGGAVAVIMIGIIVITVIFRKRGLNKKEK